MVASLENKIEVSPLSFKGELGKLYYCQEQLESLINDTISEFNTITAEPSKRICFTGNNSFQEGQIAGKKAIDLVGQTGKIAIQLPAFRDVNHALRAKGFNAYVKSHSNINICAILETDVQRDKAVFLTEKLLKDHSDLNLIYITDGHTPYAVNKTLMKTPDNRVQMLVHDIILDNVDAMLHGAVTCIIGQNTLAETYNSIINIYNNYEHGWKPVSNKMYLEPIVITRDNLEEHWNIRSSKRVITAEERSWLVKPKDRRGNNRLKIGCIIPTDLSDDQFWGAIHQGVKEAASVLEKMNVEVKKFIVFKSWFLTERLYRILITPPIEVWS